MPTLEKSGKERINPMESLVKWYLLPLARDERAGTASRVNKAGWHPWAA